MASIPYLDAMATSNPEDKIDDAPLHPPRSVERYSCSDRSGTFHHGGMAGVQQLEAASRYEVNDEIYLQQVISTSSNPPSLERLL